MSEVNPYGVAVGQVWADNDKRSKGRHVRVVAIEVTLKQAVVRACSPTGAFSGGRVTRIALRRFQPTSTGYRLVAPADEPASETAACIRCKETPSAGLCCSSHKAALCHRCYRRTHFVEVCGSTCRDCEREGIDPMTAVG
jgi:hypothetical protein